jgi:flavin reductase (DIM6/NTAB) family NADH-FMN oxidoreductase RutF
MSNFFTENIKEGMNYLHKHGAFLTTKAGDITNTMTISWGNIGFQWNRPVFTVLVRKSRYTHDLIEKANEFTVSIPLSDKMKSQLALCGSKSGRDINKLDEANLILCDGKTLSTPVIEDCELHYECKIVYKQEINSDLLDSDIKASFYGEDDYHTIYVGEIVDCYKIEK